MLARQVLYHLSHVPSPQADVFDECHVPYPVTWGYGLNLPPRSWVSYRIKTG
jgi:hypothetical protein